MVRRVTVWTMVMAFVVGLVAPVLAQQQTAPAAPAPATPAPAAKPAEPVKPAAKATETAKPAAKAAKTKSASGTIKTASGESITVIGADKKEWAFAVDKDTKITKGGKAVTSKDLAKKDPVTVKYAEAEGKMTAKVVAVKAAKAAKAAAKKPAS
jgi:hypothetical protein